MNILAIGTSSDTRSNFFTGQSVMFDGMVLVAREHGNNVEVIDISNKFRGGKLGRIMDYIVILFKMLCKMLIEKYDITYVVTSQSKWGFYRDYCICNICRLFKTPVIAHQYGANYHQLIDALAPKDIARLNKMTEYISKIIVEGEYMKKQYSFYLNYKDKVVVIPNGLPLEGKNMMTPKTYNPLKPYTLIYLSNLIYSKGYFDVLKAIDLLINREHQNVKCIFSGRFMSSADDLKRNISNKKDFDDFIVTHNLQDNVSYYSGLYGVEKDEKFHEANSFILPTYYINEGQPVSVIEAMAYGCVPIVTNYRHIPMMINDLNGLYVQPQSPESICAAVMKMIDNPSLYAELSRNSIEDYKKKFKFEVYASKVLSIFNDVVL